ncbi:hypothetical protein NLI96_g389 [Meripilus lineatus]|uniref:Uncharacterized protein n=1 Tax=Meripilus lineatus TaxID=2056292 RepID=A0AAD5VCE4_9APHY|nr:hypothetical protein NLI96_g389 [Physisporinus lineatus]
MGAMSMLALLVTHPLEFRTLLQYYLWHDQRDVSAPAEKENTGWDRESMRKCWHFLDKTSRSFAAVIKQLEGDLARVVSTHPPFRFSAPFCVFSLPVLFSAFALLSFGLYDTPAFSTPTTEPDLFRNWGTQSYFHPFGTPNHSMAQRSVEPLLQINLMCHIHIERNTQTHNKTTTLCPSTPKQQIPLPS